MKLFKILCSDTGNDCWLNPAYIVSIGLGPRTNDDGSPDGAYIDMARYDGHTGSTYRTKEAAESVTARLIKLTGDE